LTLCGEEAGFGPTQRDLCGSFYPLLPSKRAVERRLGAFLVVIAIDVIASALCPWQKRREGLSSAGRCQALILGAALKSEPRTADLFYEVEIEPASWEDRKPVRPR
jgi:hypothetical protein